MPHSTIPHNYLIVILVAKPCAHSIKRISNRNVIPQTEHRQHIIRRNLNAMIVLLDTIDSPLAISPNAAHLPVPVQAIHEAVVKEEDWVAGRGSSVSHDTPDSIVAARMRPVLYASGEFMERIDSSAFICCVLRDSGCVVRVEVPEQTMICFVEAGTNVKRYGIIGEWLNMKLDMCYHICF